MSKIIKVDSCDNCPHNGGCKAWKKLTSKQRVTLALGVGISPFILKQCDLKDEQKPVVDEQKKQMAQAIMDHCLVYHVATASFFCSHCHGDSVKNGVYFKHTSECLVIDSGKYIESLEGE